MHPVSDAVHADSSLTMTGGVRCGTALPCLWCRHHHQWRAVWQGAVDGVWSAGVLEGCCVRVQGAAVRGACRTLHEAAHPQRQAQGCCYRRVGSASVAGGCQGCVRQVCVPRGVPIPMGRRFPTSCLRHGDATAAKDGCRWLLANQCTSSGVLASSSSVLCMRCQCPAACCEAPLTVPGHWDVRR